MSSVDESIEICQKEKPTNYTTLRASAYKKLVMRSLFSDENHQLIIVFEAFSRIYCLLFSVDKKNYLKNKFLFTVWQTEHRKIL